MDDRPLEGLIGAAIVALPGLLKVRWRHRLHHSLFDCTTLCASGGPLLSVFGGPTYGPLCQYSSQPDFSPSHVVIDA